ncbi:MAG: DegT/DnrJ/EryC1/StrS family aminotransferase [Armatimonadetes bacterium]|nr:DegT/DnrJ/EryC1/StrS family aminotransferase [Armatimonadota bacterium]
MSELALFGGTPAVTNPPVERWVQVNDEVKAAVNALLDQGVVSIGGPTGVIGDFEAAFAAMTGSRYALAMNSGTATLHSAYFAVGVGPGDEVLCPAYTWHASATPIIHCAATPVFCDIRPESLTIDPDDVERRITKRTKALCVVHVFGNVCDMDRLCDIAHRHNLALIEDASHAHGALWKGKPVGSFGPVGCFSMQGGKAVSGGEAGVAITDDPEVLDRMILLGHFGRPRRGVLEVVNTIGDMSLGAKYRAHPWAIAMASVGLKRLPELNARRTANYEFLNDRLRGCPGLEVIDALPGATRAGYLELKFKLTREAVQTASRERIVEAMHAEGAPVTADRYSDLNFTYGLLHAAPLFTTVDRRTLGGCFYDPTGSDVPARPSLPVAEDLNQRLVSLPAFIDVTRESLAEVAAAMRKVMQRLGELAD